MYPRFVNVYLGEYTSEYIYGKVVYLCQQKITQIEIK